MFSIATNAAPPDPQPTAYDGVIQYWRDPVKAERKHRQIKAAIEECELVEEVDAILVENDEVIDGLMLSFPDYYEVIAEAAEDQKRMLRHAGAHAGATASTPTIAHNSDTSERQGKAMFNINTNTGGESGPFLNYKNRAGQGMGDGTWYLRSKDGDDWHYTDMTDRFKKGFIADVYATHDGQLGGSLALGFIKFTDGAAPERHVWASPLHQEQRRSEEKTVGGGYAWQNMVSFRMAIGGGESALFDVVGWSGYKGVMALIEQMNKGFGSNIGKAPLVQYTGFRVEGTGQKRLHVPEFVIGSWVDIPDCLKPDTPQVNTGAAQAEQAVQAAQANAAPAESVPQDAGF